MTIKFLYSDFLIKFIAFQEFFEFLLFSFNEIKVTRSKHEIYNENELILRKMNFIGSKFCASAS